MYYNLYSIYKIYLTALMHRYHFFTMRLYVCILTFYLGAESVCLCSMFMLFIALLACKIISSIPYDNHMQLFCISKIDFRID